jgi:DNA-binding transcriptional regulator YdaS (Cro superfamily)
MKLENWLKAENIQPSEFGRRIGVSHTSVGRWLRGVRIPRPAQMAAITRETGGAVTAADFYASASGEAA